MRKGGKGKGKIKLLELLLCGLIYFLFFLIAVRSKKGKYFGDMHVSKVQRIWFLQPFSMVSHSSATFNFAINLRSSTFIQPKIEKIEVTFKLANKHFQLDIKQILVTTQIRTRSILERNTPSEEMSMHSIETQGQKGRKKLDVVIC